MHDNKCTCSVHVKINVVILCQSGDTIYRALSYRCTGATLGLHYSENSPKALLIMVILQDISVFAGKLARNL